MKPYQFREFKRRHGLSARQIAEMTGRTSRSVFTWLNQGTPEIVDKVLGVDPADYEYEREGKRA
jgi:hypothetical protein